MPKVPPPPRWDLDHNPGKRPLGCNGKPGDSGRKAHRRKGEDVCEQCKQASNHAKRERNRGQKYPRRRKPCGTFAAATRHRKRDEPLDAPCRVAEAQYHADLRALKRAAG